MKDIIWSQNGPMNTILPPIQSSGSTEGALEEAGRAEQHITTEAAPNEFKLGEGAQSGESGPSVRWWRRGSSSGVICENHLVGSDLLCAGGHTHAQPPVEYPSEKPLEAKLLVELYYDFIRLGVRLVSMLRLQCVV